jgi:hypothetical protein
MPTRFIVPDAEQARPAGERAYPNVGARGRNRSRRDLRNPPALPDDGRLATNDTAEGPSLARRPGCCTSHRDYGSAARSAPIPGRGIAVLPSPGAS